MPSIKEFACKFCKVWTTRKEARKCIMLHMKPQHIKGEKREGKSNIKGEKREGKSNITEAMLVREIEI